MTTEEPRYTLDEARRVLARRECDRDGHDLAQHVVRHVDDAAARVLVRCDRCGATFTETTP